MPDNVAITAGVGTSVSTEEVTNLNGAAVSAQHAQRVLLTLRTADGTAVDFGPATEVSLAAVLAKLNATLAVVPTTAGDVAVTLTDGRKTVTVAGTAEALRATLACRWVTVTALKANTAPVNVGAAGVLATLAGSTGTPLDPGQGLTLPVDNAVKVFVDARVSGEGVSFTVGS